MGSPLIRVTETLGPQRFLHDREPLPRRGVHPEQARYRNYRSRGGSSGHWRRRLGRKRRCRSTGTTLGSVVDATGYDANGLFASYAAQFNGTLLYSETIGARDGDERITQRTEVVGSTTHAWTYAYDTAGRLTDVTEDGAAVSHYGYDADDNRTTFTGSSGERQCRRAVRLRHPAERARLLHHEHRDVPAMQWTEASRNDILLPAGVQLSPRGAMFSAGCRTMLQRLFR